MEEDEIALCNVCTDLVSLKKTEAFPLRLFREKRAGDWVCVRDFCEQIGMPAADLGPGVFAAWLADPMANDGYAVILFYDDESKWSMVAHYHRARLLEVETPGQTVVPAVTSRPASPVAKSLETAERDL